LAVGLLMTLCASASAATVAKPSAATVTKPIIQPERNHIIYWTPKLRTPEAQSKRPANDPFASMLLG